MQREMEETLRSFRSLDRSIGFIHLFAYTHPYLCVARWVPEKGGQVPGHVVSRHARARVGRHVALLADRDGHVRLALGLREKGWKGD